MKKIATLLTLLICMAGIVHGQKLLILERPGTTKYYIFKTGDRIRLYDGRSMRMIQGDISRITDTMIEINTLEPVYLSRVKAVYRPLTMLRIFSRTAEIAGAGYLILTGFNRAINKDVPVINPETLILSAALMGAGVATSFLRYRKFTIGDKWRLKVIYKEHPEE
jgi:hypothetical protein